jgi:hypothetical protein
MKEADRLVEANGSSVNASIEDCTAVLIEEANLMVEATASTTSTIEDEPLTRIARGLKQAEALLLQTEESNTEETKLDIAKQFVTNDDSQNVSEYFTPGADPSVGSDTQKSHPQDLKAPTPSRSFSNISKIEKIVDPLDPLVFSNLKSTCSLTDANEESMERRLDSDYIPCYSGRATSESEISVVDTYFRGATTSNA